MARPATYVTLKDLKTMEKDIMKKLKSMISSLKDKKKAKKKRKEDNDN